MESVVCRAIHSTYSSPDSLISPPQVARRPDPVRTPCRRGRTKLCSRRPASSSTNSTTNYRTSWSDRSQISLTSHGSFARLLAAAKCDESSRSSSSSSSRRFSSYAALSRTSRSTFPLFSDGRGPHPRLLESGCRNFVPRADAGIDVGTPGPSERLGADEAASSSPGTAAATAVGVVVAAERFDAAATSADTPSAAARLMESLSDEGALRADGGAWSPGNAEVVKDDEARIETRERSTGEVGNEVGGRDAKWGEEMWEQARSVVGFAGPAMGIWLSHPIMSLIDTAVVGQGSSTELAALGPGTVVCDQVSYLFMFLSIATNSLIATAMAQQDPEQASRHLAQLLFVALACGLVMTALSLRFTPHAITAFVGSNTAIIPAACVYAKIRAYAWPAVLVTSVAQSASMGLQDVWGPLRCLAVASAVNLGGDLLLCPLLGYGIAGAAWATMASQYVGALLMLHSLHASGRIRLSITPPSLPTLLTYLSLTGPIFASLLAKVGFYTLVTFKATTLGTIPLAAHQVLIGVFSLCAVCAEPLSQTAQSFLPRLCVGVNRNMHKAQRLLLTLVIIALLLGTLEAAAALLVSLRLPFLFTSDPAVIAQIARIAPPLAVSLLLNPIVLSSEGALLASRDVVYMASTMSAATVIGALMLQVAHRYGLSLAGNWWILVLFNAMRLVAAVTRLASRKGVFREQGSPLPVPV